jgi:hypothetical protein
MEDKMKKYVILCLLVITPLYLFAQSELYSGDIDYIYRHYIYSYYNSPTRHFNLSNNDLRILRNTIYARHGYLFKSKDLQEHFQKFEWYKGTKENVEDELSEDERCIIRIILATESANPPSINDLIGLWESPAPPGSNASTLGFVGIYLNRDGTMNFREINRNMFWSFDGTTFRYRRDSTEKFNVTENIRINFIEYNGVLYKTCIFFRDCSIAYNGWDFYGPNRRPPAELWGYKEQ